MSFDKANGRPLVNVHRRATKVNIWMVVAVVAFMVFGMVVLFTLR